MTSISTAVILMYSAPVFVLIYSIIFFKEKITPKKLIAVIFILVGCGLVSGIIGDIKFDLLGIIVGLLSGISYALYNIFTKIEMHNNSNPLTVSFYNFAVMSLAALIICDAPKLITLFSKNPVFTFPMAIGLGICTCVLPYFLYTLGIKSLPAGVASALGIVEPMSATIFSVLLFGEKLTV